MMYTNADMTLYLYSKEGKTEKYTRKTVKGVYWEDVRNASFMKTGQRNAVSALVVIPKESLTAPITFTQGRDLAVKGIIPYEVDNSSQEALSRSLETLRRSHECVTVMTVDERLYGSEDAQHYELSCK